MSQHEFIIDSSKNPFWIRYQQDLLQRQGIATRHLLIWKTSLEFAYSCKKRNRPGWLKEWVNYHRLYFTLLPEWRAIKYADLAQDEGALFQQICTHLNIPHFADKEEYWHKQHHTLGGNYSARLHLYSQQDAASYVEQSFDKSRMNSYRSIYYRNVEDPALQLEVDQAIADSVSAQQILSALQDGIIDHGEVNHQLLTPLHFPLSALLMRRVKDRLRTHVGRYRYGSSITQPVAAG